MYLAGIDVYADPAIVDRYKGGFVQKFHGQAQCIVEFYRGLLRRQVATKATRQLVFVFTDVIRKPPGRLIELDCHWPFDFARYTTATDSIEKKRLIATSLRDALVWSSAHLEISPALFEAAYKKMSASEFTLRGVSKLSWLSPDGRHRVRVVFLIDIDGVHLTAVLFRNRSKREIARVSLGIGPAQTDTLNTYLANGHWVDDHVFELKSADFMRKTWRADFSQLLKAQSAP
jgi:hypothetical protein